MTAEIVRTACPHDCPSACALEVERLSPTRIGRVRGNAELPFTAGVVCEKVGRYAERVHHPDRLTHPMKRVGAKGEGKFERIGWDEALDTVAEAAPIFLDAKTSDRLIRPAIEELEAGQSSGTGLDLIQNRAKEILSDE